MEYQKDQNFIQIIQLDIIKQIELIERIQSNKKKEKNIKQSNPGDSQIKQLSLENLLELQQQHELAERFIKEEQQLTLNNQRTTQNDLIQIILDKLQSNFQLEVTQDVYEKKIQQKNELKDVSELNEIKEEEEHKVDEQEEPQEEEKLEQKESDGQLQREFVMKSMSSDKIMNNKNLFEIIKVKTINNEMKSQVQVQVQDNKQNDDQQTEQQFQELINSFQKKVSQQQESESTQTKLNQYIYGTLSSISKQQQQQFISMLQQSNNNKTLEEFSDLFGKSFDLKENFESYVKKQNSQNIQIKDLYQDVTVSQLNSIFNQKNKSDFDSELTIKKGKIKKKVIENQTYKQKISNIYETNIINYIKNSANNIYSFNNKIQSQNNDYDEQQYNDIQFQTNMIVPALYKLISDAKRLSIEIDQSKQPTLMFDSILELCKILQLNGSFCEAFQQQNLNLCDQLQLQKLNQFELFFKKHGDMLLELCDLYIEEVEKREAINKTTQENNKELREFHEHLKQTKTLWVGVKQKYIKILPIKNEQLDLIKKQLQHIDQDSLNQVNNELNVRNFYLESYLANGGEADILQGYQFKQNVIKQDCIYRCMQKSSKSFQYEQEYALVRSIQQPKNIIQYLDSIYLQDINQVVFVVEKCQLSLSDELKIFQSRNMIDEFKLIQIVLDLTEGLIEMRIYKIVHGDIKPANILITQNGYYVYSDFGLANFVEFEDMGIKNKGYSRSYSPPEQLNKKKNITYKSDIYSLGKSIIKLIDIINGINCSEQTRNISLHFKQLANDYMIQGDPKQRYDCLEIFLEFYEKIFTNQYNNQYKSFLEVYLRKVKLIITNNDFQLSQDQKSQKNFDYEYYKKTLYAYCILYIRIVFFINRTIIDQQQLEESIQNNTFEEYNIINNEVALSLSKIGDYFKLQNNQEQAIQYYKQEFSIYKQLETSTEVITPLSQMTRCYIEISKHNEILQYLLDENELCEGIFGNNEIVALSFESNILKICQYYPQQEQDLQNILEGLESLKNYKKQFFLQYFMLLEKIIKIYKLKKDSINELKYSIELYLDKLKYLPKLGYNALIIYIDNIIQLHNICQQDYSNFIISQLDLHVQEPNSDINQKRLYLLHLRLGKFYYQSNQMESSFEHFQKAINLQENLEKWVSNEQQELFH